MKHVEFDELQWYKRLLCWLEIGLVVLIAIFVWIPQHCYQQYKFERALKKRNKLK